MQGQSKSKRRGKWAASSCKMVAAANSNRVHRIQNKNCSSDLARKHCGLANMLALGIMRQLYHFVQDITKIDLVVVFCLQQHAKYQVS